MCVTTVVVLMLDLCCLIECHDTGLLFQADDIVLPCLIMSIVCGAAPRKYRNSLLSGRLTGLHFAGSSRQLLHVSFVPRSRPLGTVEVPNYCPHVVLFRVV